jgi:hypothetical protein
MLRDTTLNWCHNYMSKLLDYIFSKLIWHVPNSLRHSNVSPKLKTTKGQGVNDAPPSSFCDPKGSKKLDLRNWSKTWCCSQLPALKGVEGSCWKLRD